MLHQRVCRRFPELVLCLLMLFQSWFPHLKNRNKTPVSWGITRLIFAERVGAAWSHDVLYGVNVTIAKSHSSQNYSH